ncbi:MAG: hemolysin family protein [Shimia sp.]
MGEQTEGSSDAARRAPGGTSDDRTGDEANAATGLMTRLIRAFQPEADEGAEGQPGPDRAALGLVNLRRMRVSDVLIPKAEVVAVPVGAGIDELIETFRESGFTRLPVFDGTLDSPLGMAHLKDIALKHGFNGGGEDMDLRASLRPLLYVPPSMPIGVLLTRMQTDRVHMALVIDEYGGTDGLVTIEDLIEQVIGEIEDEHDTDEAALWTEEKPGCFLAYARTPLDAFEEAIGLRLTGADGIDGEEIDTLGGLVFMLSGHIPARGQVVIHPAGPEFEVVDADPRRIKRLRVRVPETTPRAVEPVGEARDA